MADLYPIHASGILASPSTAPVIASSAGALSNGAYLVAYAYLNVNGRTKISPYALIAIDDDEQIDVSAITPLPAGATSVDWFVSDGPNSTTLRFIVNNSGGAFSINTLPAPTASLPPLRNSTGGTGIRINKYIKHVKRLDEITLVSTFEDKSADFNRSAPDCPQRYTLQYTNKPEEQKQLIIDFYLTHGIDLSFDFQEPRGVPFVRGEPGELVTGVCFEEPPDVPEHTVRWNQTITVKLIKRPS